MKILETATCGRPLRGPEAVSVSDPQRNRNCRGGTGTSTWMCAARPQCRQISRELSAATSFYKLPIIREGGRGPLADAFTMFVSVQRPLPQRSSHLYMPTLCWQKERTASQSRRRPKIEKRGFLLCEQPIYGFKISHRKLNRWVTTAADCINKAIWPSPHAIVVMSAAAY